jgi:GNAT superfamily N-acetyltransferase
MTVQIREEPPSVLAEYARVPIAFEVLERLAVSAPNGGLGGLRLSAESVAAPYVKDYDADPDHRPTAWARRFDLTRWGVLAGRVEGECVGGAAVAWGTSGLAASEGRTDLAVLWDLRVAPALRGRGVGQAIFRAAEAWAAARGARWLKVETQNVNVRACRFYARQGCVLGAVHRFAYPDLPEEAQLLWYKLLEANAGASSRVVAADNVARLSALG